MTAAEAPNTAERAPRVWPLPVKAYHALSELGLIPEKTELLHAPEKQVETYSRPTGDRYAERSTSSLGERLTSVVVPGFSVVLGKLFAD